MAEKEYIEREAVLALLKDDREVCADSKAELKYIRADIRAIPAADVRPVVRGEWTRIDYEPHGYDYKCSACGWKNDMPTHFCPNCGANMSEES